MQLITNGNIFLDIDEVVESNHAMVMFGSAPAIPSECLRMLWSWLVLLLLFHVNCSLFDEFDSVSSLESVLVEVPRM